MLTRRTLLSKLPLIVPAAALPALVSCHSTPQQAPLSAGALSAVDPALGAQREPLARAIDDLFADADAGETRALLLLRGGELIAERYAPGYGAKTRLLGWSMAKSVTTVLIGLLVADGRLRLDQPAPIPAWQRAGDPRGEITLRQLLQMRSGLAHKEEATPSQSADTVRMLFLDGRDDMAAYAEAQPLDTAPGSRFVYSTSTSIILADIAARVLTDLTDADSRRRAVSEYLYTRLFDPAGLRSMAIEFDTAGTFVGGSLVHANAHDWARFGELLRNGGAVRGAQIVPHDWISFMTSPSPRNPAYGAGLWLNRAPSDADEELFPGRAPASLFSCIGHLGQYVMVLPEARLTLVRLGKTDAAARPGLLNHLAEVVSLAGSAADAVG